ncbi:MAG: O-antigen ligase family protein [Planctomycetes bacterium]|nr:O-antigen ligase family protein [Planctomycetota bacterium]
MAARQQIFGRGSAAGPRVAATLADRLTLVVDGCLACVVLLAPYFLGGRHPIGQLVYVVLSVAMAVAWCWRQWLQGDGGYRFSGFELLLVGAILLIAVQIAPLSAGMLDKLSPATTRIVSASTAADGQQLSAWSTISLAPSATRDGLAVLLSHGLILLVTIQRVRTINDVQRMLWLLAGGALLMAVVGLAQYACGNGRFMWVYDHPFRNSDGAVKGSFINKNHFAHFLALGIGPLMWCMLRGQRDAATDHERSTSESLIARLGFMPLAVGLAIVLFAGLCSLSRGGAIAMGTALCVSTLLLWRSGAISLRYVGMLTAVVVVLSGILMFHGVDQIGQRLDDLTEGSVQRLDNAQARRRLWEANGKAYGDYRWFGTGVGSHAEVYPIYISEWFPKEYTHAESGYFQIASTTGSAGLVLLLSAIGLGGFLIVRTALTAPDRRHLACLAAVGGSLAASAIHSVVDFVWFIPACMGMTAIATGCAVRIWMLSRPKGDASIRIPRMAWGMMTIAVALVGAGIIASQWGPAYASLEWDAYLRDDVALQQMAQSLAERKLDSSATDVASSVGQRRASMYRHLQAVVTRDPNDGRAHLRLAGACLLRFEECQQTSQNAMTLSQVCDAAMASKFATRQELDGWLQRALGENAQYLHAALWHTRQGLSLLPLQGEGYVFLAQLCFLEGGDAQKRVQLIAQALKLRPHSESVLIGAAEEAWLRGDQEAMLRYGKQAFHLGGKYRPVVIQNWVGRFPVALLVEQLEPDLDDWPELFAAYTNLGQQDELRILCRHFVKLAEEHPTQCAGLPAARMWTDIGMFNQSLQESAAAAECARRAMRCSPDDKKTRFTCSVLLCSAGQLEEAEPHVRWCLQRMPNHPTLLKLAKQVAEARLQSNQRIAAGPESGSRQ